MKTTIYYVIQNNGDGSASPKFFTSPMVANIYRQYEEKYHDGFCESFGSFTIESNSSITSNAFLSADAVIKILEKDIAICDSYGPNDMKETLGKWITILLAYI